MSIFHSAAYKVAIVKNGKLKNTNQYLSKPILS